MDFVASRKDLLRILQYHSIADKKSPLPTLSNVLVTAKDGKVTIAVTDMYLGMRGTCDAEVATPGTMGLPAKDLFERVKVMPDGPVQIRKDADTWTAHIKAVGTKRWFDVHGLPPDDFPTLPSPDPDAQRRAIPAETLRLLLDRTHFSISDDTTRPNVNSLCLDWRGAALRAAATDGHRMSIQNVVSPNPDVSDSVLIPLAAVIELRKFVSNADGDIVAHRTRTVLFCDAGPLTFSCVLADAAFPPYEQVVPRVHIFARVARAPLVDALNAARLAAADPQIPGGVEVTVSPGTLRVMSSTAAGGAAGDEVSADYEGREIRIGLNSTYLLQALSALDSDDVNLSITGELDPMVIQPADNGDYTAIVMPVRI